MIEFMRKIWRKLFFRKVECFESGVICNVKEEIKKPKEVKPRRTIKTFKEETDRLWDFMEFEDYIGKDGYSINVGEGVIKALRAVGLFILPFNPEGNDEGDGFISRRYEWRHDGLPAMAFIGFSKECIGEGWRHQTAFAFKLRKKEARETLEMVKANEEIYVCGWGSVDPSPPRWFRQAKNKVVWFHFPYAINKDTGKSRLLRWKEKKSVKVGKEHYTQICWRHPNDGQRKEDDMLQDYTLALILNAWARRDMHWQIEMRKPGNEGRIVGCVPQNEAKYYFRDREIDDGGKRKAIFHWVRAHHRNTGTKIASVKTHFRGNREFVWGDYNVSIRVPQKHTPMITSIQDAGRHSTKKGTVDLHKVLPAMTGTYEELETLTKKKVHELAVESHREYKQWKKEHASK